LAVTKSLKLDGYAISAKRYALVEFPNQRFEDRSNVETAPSVPHNHYVLRPSDFPAVRCD
jgi:hypothetical protein